MVCISGEQGFTKLQINNFETGTVNIYLGNNPNADKLKINLGIARGLEYLHCMHILRSIIKVLISKLTLKRVVLLSYTEISKL